MEFSLAVAYLLVSFFLPRLSSLLIRAGMVRENYRGEKVPVPLGLVFSLVLPPVYGVLSLFQTAPAGLCLPHLFPLFFFVTGMGLLGLCDDLLKDDKHKGLRGHLGELRKGRLTSGGIKALFGLVFSLLFAAGIRAPGEDLSVGAAFMLVMRALVAALAANTLNLFDLRPGRAVKAYLFLIFLPVFFLRSGRIDLCYLYLLLPAVAGVFAYMPYDLQARGMLGDTGANYLGALLGGLVILYGDPLFIGGALFILVFLHVFAEKISFTRVIAKNRFLKFLDELGRE